MRRNSSVYPPATVLLFLLFQPPHLYRPERWQNIPDAVSAIPGVWANILSFLGGPRACIGYRLSLVEYVFPVHHVTMAPNAAIIRIKALLFTLVRAFEFELAVPASSIAKKQGIVQRPMVITEKEDGNQMPLLMRPYAGDDLN
jgi:hypothetical protein